MFLSMDESDNVQNLWFMCTWISETFCYVFWFEETVDILFLYAKKGS